MSYKLTPDADEDLIAINIYGVENFGETRALQFLRSLENTFQLIADIPRIGLRHGSDTTRRFFHGHYTIYYTIQPDHVLILRIVHGSMNFEL